MVIIELLWLICTHNQEKHKHKSTTPQTQSNIRSEADMMSPSSGKTLQVKQMDWQWGPLL